jgi:AraC family transcriptional regulator
MTESSRAKALCSVPFAVDERRAPESDLPVVQCAPLIGSNYDKEIDRDRSHLQQRCTSENVSHPTVEISPRDLVRRRTIAGHGITAESVQCTSQSIVKFRFRAPLHLLVGYERGERHDGETFVEGLPRSTLRNLARKLTLVPAGHEYRGWHDPRTQTHLIYFYFDPAKLKARSRPDIAGTFFAPQLFFENPVLRQTIIKLKSLFDSAAAGDCSYFDALGMVLVHELTRLNRAIVPRIRGGLAAWQQRIVTAYIDEHVAEQIPLTRLSELVRLSRHHFCRSFKASFGTPPHRYQLDRRIERAKLLLTDAAGISVTDTAMTLGFDSSNSFSRAFRKATGFTPTDFRRSEAGVPRL